MRVVRQPAPGAQRNAGRFGLRDVLQLVLLLTLPAAALFTFRAHIEWHYAGTYLAFISLGTYATYGSDKWRARQGHWRTAESTLHLLELAGGWPGAFIAQRRFRHKTAKRSFLAIFWIIVFVHQAIAADSLQQFRLTQTAFQKVTGIQWSHPPRR